MRTENKYIRNRRFRTKAWNRIRSKEQPYRTFCPYNYGHGIKEPWSALWDTQEQIDRHFEWINKQARAIDSGTHKHWHHASASFRRTLNEQRRAKERSVLERINNGNYDLEVPLFKRDADWLYF